MRAPQRRDGAELETSPRRRAQAIDIATAKARLGLDQAAIDVVREKLREERLPSDAQRVERWVLLLADDWSRKHAEDDFPYQPAGLLISWARRQASLERRRKRAAAQGKVIQEDRQLFLRLYEEEQQRQLDAAHEELGPPPPEEPPPWRWRLQTRWREEVFWIAERRALERLATREDTVGEQATALINLRLTEARRLQKKRAPLSGFDHELEERVDAYLEGKRDHLLPLPEKSPDPPAGLPEDEPL